MTIPKLIEIEVANYERETLELRAEFKRLGLQAFDSLSIQFKQIPAGVYHVETDILFSNQYNTSEGLRIFEKCSRLIEHKGGEWRKGEGYYIARGIEELRAAQAERHVCGYCGAQYDLPKQTFCDKCLDSPYLKADELYLLRLMPVKGGIHGGERPALSEAERAELLPRYVERQTTGADSRAAERLRRQRADIAKKYDTKTKAAKTEHDGMIWLMDHGISVDNVIYYPHVNKFSFGWRSGLSAEVKAALETRLVKFPFTWEFSKNKY